jgi:hypothetical protein
LAPEIECVTRVAGILTGYTPFECASSVSHRFRVAVLLPALWLGAVNSAWKANAQVAVLEFNQPTNNAVFSNLDEIPILLRGIAGDDVFPTAELFADGKKIADLSYCCAFCPCAAPQNGRETILQIPIPWNGTSAPPRLFQGWTNPPVGVHRLNARALGEHGTAVEAPPVTVTVFDRRLEIFENTDGTVTLVIPQGSLVPGNYHLEASDDLGTWTTVGEFGPGNVAAFYFSIPIEKSRKPQFYRSLYLPP